MPPGAAAWCTTQRAVPRPFCTCIIDLFVSETNVMRVRTLFVKQVPAPADSCKWRWAAATTAGDYCISTIILYGKNTSKVQNLQRSGLCVATPYAVIAFHSWTTGRANDSKSAFVKHHNVYKPWGWLTQQAKLFIARGLHYVYGNEGIIHMMGPGQVDLGKIHIQS